MKKCIFLFLILGLSGCVHNTKLSCYEQELARLKKSTIYKRIITSAQISLPKLVDAQNNFFFINPLYIDSAKLDDAVFLNRSGDKCILIILQKTSKDVKSDQIRILHGMRLDGEWQYSVNKMPRLPQITYSIGKSVEGTFFVNNSFETLSEKGREYILNFGDVSSYNCEVDYRFWFDE